MSCLHLITTTTLPDDFAVFSEDDEAVLLSEGVYLSVTGKTKVMDGFTTIFMLQDDVQMRGLPQNTTEYQVIAQKDLVELVLKHQRSISWT